MLNAFRRLTNILTTVGGWFIGMGFWGVRFVYPDGHSDSALTEGIVMAVAGLVLMIIVHAVEDDSAAVETS